MYYIVQKNLFREEGLVKLINFLERFEFDYELIDVKSDIDEIECITERKDIFIFGSLRMARLSKIKGWNPGALITENHDYNVYSKHYKENLLNYDSKIVEFSEDFEWSSDKYFIRPCLDSKTFTGRVFSKEEWMEFRERVFSGSYKSTLKNDTLVQIARPKEITQEVRLWVVNGEIITQSTYRRGSYVVYDNIVDDDAIEFAKKMVDIFQLAQTFTIDVCLTGDEWKIVECGSTACAGFYDADIQKLVMALDECKF